MEEFKNWQQECKNISYKVSMDNASRVKRVLSILCIDNITQCSLSDLEANDSFKALSVSVKSQMRRAVRLYIEYVDAHSKKACK